MALVLRIVGPLAMTVFALAGPSLAQQAHPVDSATAATARRLLELTGAAQLTLRGMETMVPAQRLASPQIPAAFWDAFLARARHDISHLVDSLIPIYAAHFTKAELQQLVQFYQTPLGRHLAEVQPLVVQESMQAGQRWGMVIGRDIGDSLARAGVTLQKPN